MPKSTKKKFLEQFVSKKTITKLSKAKRRFLKHIWLARFTLLAVILLVVYLIARIFLQITNLEQFVDPAKNFIFTSNAQVPTHEGRTNILVMGRGGEGHEAPDLTDTMLLVSISHEDPKASMISIPRDIWIDSLNAKINSSYFWGKRNGTGGLKEAKKNVEFVTGEPVHYAMVMDFSGFKEVIDTLGGVEVDVEHSFTDTEYPIAGRENDLCDGDPEYRCRYETIEFKQGRQYMDGETALKFVRSRHAEGDEGNDFARSARQQRVISAIREKVLTTGILFNPQKINELVSLAEKLVETDVPKDVGGVLARRGYEARENISSHVLPEDLLMVPPISVRYQRQYVFIPKNSWQDIHNWVQSVLP